MHLWCVLIFQASWANCTILCVTECMGNNWNQADSYLKQSPAGRVSKNIDYWRQTLSKGKTGAKQHQCIWEQMNMINLSLNFIAFIQQNNIPLEVNQSRALAHAVVVIESQHQRQQCESYSPFTSQLWFIQRLLVWFAWQAGDFWWKTHHASSAGCRCQPCAALPEALGLWEPLGASRQQCWHNSGEPFPTVTTEQKLEPVHSTSLINLKQQ